MKTILRSKGSFTTFFFFVVTIFSSCSRSEKGQTANLKMTKVGDLVVYSQLLTMEDICQNAREKGEILNEDSVKSFLKRNVLFLITIKPNKDKIGNSDILANGVNSWDEYQSKMQTMNFSMEPFFELLTNKSRTKALYVHFENYYGLSNKVVFNVGFGSSDDKEFEVIYTDPFYNLGQVHFYYNMQDTTQN